MGNLASDEVDDYVQSVIERVEGFGTDCGWSDKSLFIPSRNTESRVEILPCKPIPTENIAEIQDLINAKFSEYMKELEESKLEHRRQLDLIRDNYSKSIQIIRNYPFWKKIIWAFSK